MVFDVQGRFQSLDLFPIGKDGSSEEDGLPGIDLPISMGSSVEMDETWQAFKLLLLLVGGSQIWRYNQIPFVVEIPLETHYDFSQETSLQKHGGFSPAEFLGSPSTVYTLPETNIAPRWPASSRWQPWISCRFTYKLPMLEKLTDHPPFWTYIKLVVNPGGF